MKSFLLSVIKQVLAFIVAVFLVGFLFFILIFTLIGVIERTPVHLPKNSVLIINLAMDITDTEENMQFMEHAQDLINAATTQTAYLLEVIDAIEVATKDPRIIGIFLKGGASYAHQSSGYPVLHEVREAIKEFQKSGKQVVTYFTEADIKDYFLGSVANTVILNPLGQIQLTGLAIEMAYFGDTFEKYGIGMQITKSGKYKSAVEPFTSSHMSDFEKEQMTTLLDDMWDSIVTTVGESRNLDKKDLRTLSEKTALFLAKDAKDNKLIDLIEYEDEAFAHFNLNDEEKKKSSDHKIGLRKYIRDAENKKLLKKVTEHKPKIGIVYVEGEISEGNGTSLNAGADRLERRLNKIREDENIKAVVLRVNSPGGGVHASEKILRAVRLLQTKKPVVVSFGTYAASGGYWVSCYGDAIFTDPMTITGSIGVFGLLPNVEKIAKNYGVNFEAISTGPFGSINSYTKPRTAEELAKLQDYTDLMYHLFLTRVSEGRKLEIKDVEGIAEGRVWSGFRAKQIGLADFYGGLKNAISHAAVLAKLSDDWEVSQYADEQKLSYEILRLFQETSEDQVSVKGMFSAYLKYIEKEVKSLSNFNDPSSIYARLPFSFLPN